MPSQNLLPELSDSGANAIPAWETKDVLALQVDVETFGSAEIEEFDALNRELAVFKGKNLAGGAEQEAVLQKALNLLPPLKAVLESTKTKVQPSVLPAREALERAIKRLEVIQAFKGTSEEEKKRYVSGGEIQDLLDKKTRTSKARTAEKILDRSGVNDLLAAFDTEAAKLAGVEKIIIKPVGAAKDADLAVAVSLLKRLKGDLAIPNDASKIEQALIALPDGPKKILGWTKKTKIARLRHIVTLQEIRVEIMAQQLILAQDHVELGRRVQDRNQAQEHARAQFEKAKNSIEGDPALARSFPPKLMMYLDRSGNSHEASWIISAGGLSTIQSEGIAHQHNVLEEVKKALEALMKAHGDERGAQDKNLPAKITALPGQASARAQEIAKKIVDGTQQIYTFITKKAVALAAIKAIAAIGTKLTNASGDNRYPQPGEIEAEAYGGKTEAQMVAALPADGAVIAGEVRKTHQDIAAEVTNLGPYYDARHYAARVAGPSRVRMGKHLGDLEERSLDMTENVKAAVELVTTKLGSKKVEMEGKCKGLEKSAQGLADRFQIELEGLKTLKEELDEIVGKIEATKDDAKRATAHQIQLKTTSNDKPGIAKNVETRIGDGKGEYKTFENAWDECTREAGRLEAEDTAENAKSAYTANRADHGAINTEIERYKNAVRKLERGYRITKATKFYEPFKNSGERLEFLNDTDDEHYVALDDSELAAIENRKGGALKITLTPTQKKDIEEGKLQLGKDAYQEYLRQQYAHEEEANIDVEMARLKGACDAELARLEGDQEKKQFEVDAGKHSIGVLGQKLVLMATLYRTHSAIAREAGALIERLTKYLHGFTTIASKDTVFGIIEAMKAEHAEGQALEAEISKKLLAAGSISVVTTPEEAYKMLKGAEVAKAILQKRRQIGVLFGEPVSKEEEERVKKEKEAIEKQTVGELKAEICRTIPKPPGTAPNSYEVQEIKAERKLIAVWNATASKVEMMYYPELQEWKNK